LILKILYFARVRQIAGRNEEELELPASVKTVSELIDFLSARDERVANALSDRRTLRAAVNRSHVRLDALIAGAAEVAFFPPVTGG
jgi:molybdopterin synthase sulfur carrier subunit